MHKICCPSHTHPRGPLFFFPLCSMPPRPLFCFLVTAVTQNIGGPELLFSTQAGTACTRNKQECDLTSCSPQSYTCNTIHTAFAHHRREKKVLSSYFEVVSVMVYILPHCARCGRWLTPLQVLRVFSARSDLSSLALLCKTRHKECFYNRRAAHVSDGHTGIYTGLPRCARIQVYLQP